MTSITYTEDDLSEAQRDFIIISAEYCATQELARALNRLACVLPQPLGKNRAYRLELQTLAEQMEDRCLNLEEPVLKARLHAERIEAHIRSRRVQ